MVLLSLVVVAGFLVALAWRDQPAEPLGEEHDLDRVVADFVADLSADAPYRAPDPDERAALAQVVDRLASGSATEVADRVRALGYETREGVDKPTGRPYVVLAHPSGTERAWGMFVVDRSRSARVIVEVPHPASDLRTEDIGLALFRRGPGAVLAVSGTHRRAAGGAGDVAHRADSMFHAVTDTLARRGLPQVQLHGYDDASLPEADIVISPGATETTPALRSAAEGLSGAGLRVCQAWSQRCGELEGRRNEQGVAAAEHGATFVHVEMNATVRDDRDRWDSIVDVLGDTDFG
ncbi:hypothetical protein [Alloactinosynnema sp. L-07]|uniref:hypothetical protein n=1 Tax=Alloactinosynnema sp. L-07 TaxID=1653480 RepID=UPI000B2F468C|nr:hypothetical protein [Alloactinosynnema sp. L-07]